MITQEIADAMEERLRGSMRDLALRIEKLERQRDLLYAERLALWRRAVDEGWTHARIADASRCGENAVSQVFHRARRRGR